MWFKYEVSPIDFCWGHLNTVEETAKNIAELEVVERLYKSPAEGPSLSDFLNAWESAKEAARGIGWEGDFRNNPVVFWVPHDTDFQYGFVIKQDNNGSTFVISPVELRHLNSI